jgi:hypothetical protein
VARVDSRPLTDSGSRLEVVAAALADQAAEVEIVAHDARDLSRADRHGAAAGAPVPPPAAALEALLGEARAEAAAAREELAARVAGESELVATAGRLRLELDGLRERLAARDARDARVAGLVAEVADAAREAREEVQRHVVARGRAEAELAGARERLAALHDDLETQRARTVAAEQALEVELDAAHTARDRALAAEDAASAAREAELSALKAAHARLRPNPEGEPVHEGEGQLAESLARAQQRLRDATPPDSPAAPAPAVAAPPRPVAHRRAGLLRRLFRARR